ncbi:MAG TPA: hypothetical protein VGD88_17160 [Opitutaceae bacterium]
MPLPKEHAWFPRKSYGWGWGIPSRWQGWVVLGAYLAALMAINVDLLRSDVLWRVGSIIGLSILLIAICYWKGEAPRWSWGAENKNSAAKIRRH